MISFWVFEITLPIKSRWNIKTKGFLFWMHRYSPPQKSLESPEIAPLSIIISKSTTLKAFIKISKGDLFIFTCFHDVVEQLF